MAGKGRNTIIAQLYSTEDQTPGDLNPALVTFNAQGFVNRIIHDPISTPGEIKVPEDGMYKINGNFHCGKGLGGENLHIVVFAQKNNDLLVGSTIDTNVKDVDNHPQISFDYIAELKAFDLMCFFIQVTDATKGLGLIHEVAAGGIPEIPSVKMTIFKID